MVLLLPFNLDAFYFVIALTRTSSTVLNRSGESLCPCLVPDLRSGRGAGRAGSFQSFIIELAVNFLYMPLIMLRMFVLIPTLLGVLS